MCAQPPVVATPSDSPDHQNARPDAVALQPGRRESTICARGRLLRRAPHAAPRPWDTDNGCDRPLQADGTPLQADNKPLPADSKPLPADSKSPQTDHQPPQTDSKPLQRDYRPLRADYSPLQPKARSRHCNRLRATVAPASTSSPTRLRAAGRPFCCARWYMIYVSLKVSQPNVVKKHCFIKMNNSFYFNSFIASPEG